MNPRYPLYVVSKGRWESRLTSKALEKMNVPYRIVVEPQESERYAAVIDPAKILVTPFSNLGQGSIPARNFVWEHALSQGAARFWLCDDNIKKFATLGRNVKVGTNDPAIFGWMEHFTDQYTNIAISGPNYWMFCPSRQKTKPYTANTRVYSCMLIRSDLPYRFRGRYNEDTDLSLRALKDCWCTALFNAFLIEKMTTMTMRGGNTAELYQGDGRLKMAQSLVDQHPDIARATFKFGRIQHQVDYRPFKSNRLILKREVAT